MTADIDCVKDALMAIDPNLGREDWHRVGCSAIAAGLSIDDIDEWSSSAGNYTGLQDVKAAFKTIKRDGAASEKTLFWFARKSGWVDDPKQVKNKATKPAPATHTPRPPDQPQHTSLSDWGHTLWKSTMELFGVAVVYLEHRHCVVPPRYGDLRWHPALKHPSGHVGPGLVALVTDIHTNEPLSLHRTWICSTGKAEVYPQRMQLAHHSLKNGVIRLWPNDEVGHVLGISEGIETGLSMAHAVQPVWACMDAGHLEKFPVLPGVRELFIAQDADPAGARATAACAQRWHAAGRLVQISSQPTGDLNDALGVAQ